MSCAISKDVKELCDKRHGTTVLRIVIIHCPFLIEFAIFFDSHLFRTGPLIISGDLSIHGCTQPHHQTAHRSMT